MVKVQCIEAIEVFGVIKCTYLTNKKTEPVLWGDNFLRKFENLKKKSSSQPVPATYISKLSISFTKI